MHYYSLAYLLVLLSFYLSFPLSLIDSFFPSIVPLRTSNRLPCGSPPFQACVFYMEVDGPTAWLRFASASGNLRPRCSGRLRCSSYRAQHSSTISALTRTQNHFTRNLKSECAVEVLRVFGSGTLGCCPQFCSDVAAIPCPAPPLKTIYQPCDRET